MTNGLAPGKPVQHAVLLGVVGFVLSLAGAVLSLDPSGIPWGS